jgi:hypothetical protein
VRTSTCPVPIARARNMPHRKRTLPQAAPRPPTVRTGVLLRRGTLSPLTLLWPLVRGGEDGHVTFEQSRTTATHAACPPRTVAHTTLDMHPCVQVSIASTLKPKPTLCQTGRAPPATRLLPSQETTRLSLTSRRALSRTHTCLTARSAALTRRMGQQRSRPLRQQARATTRPSATASIVLGVDIGGSGIKGALVDVTTGKLVTERHRIPTPKGATPKDVCDTVRRRVATQNLPRCHAQRRHT